jgi:CHAT domain-containing protein
MKDFDYIHFTCHGLLNDDFQGLVLSQLPPDKAKALRQAKLELIKNKKYRSPLFRSAFVMYGE